MTSLSRHPLLHHFTLCACSLVMVDVAYGAFNIKEAAPISLTQKIDPVDVIPISPISLHVDTLTIDTMPLETATPVETAPLEELPVDEEPAPPPQTARSAAFPDIKVNLTSTEAFLTIQSDPFGAQDRIMEERNLWSPQLESVMAKITNFQVSDLIVGEKESNKWISITATTHFIQPIATANLGGNSAYLLKPSFVTALGADVKLKGFLATVSVWNDTGSLSSYVDASVGYETKGLINLGAKFSISDNLTAQQTSNGATVWTGHTFPGLSQTEWRIAANFINTPYAQNSGGNLEFGIQGKWEEDSRLSYNLAAKAPLYGGSQIEKDIRVGFGATYRFGPTPP